MIGRLAQFWGLVRELDVRRIRSDLERTPRFAVRGAEGSGRRTLTRSLLGPLAPAVDPLPATAETDPRTDLTILVADGRQDSTLELRHLAIDLGELGPLLVVFTHADEVLDPEVRDERKVATTTAAGARGVWVDARDSAAVSDVVGAALLELLPDHMLGLGRAVPALRDQVATHLIRDASRVNAEFALMTNLPAVIPIAGGVVGDMADVIVLTKNQAVLVFKLAGVYGRDVGDLRAMAMEILPVVGGAFLWRTIARAGVGLLPPLVAALPKTAVAYGGTYVVGEMARYYFENGAKPPTDAVRRFQAEGLRLYGDLAGRLVSRTTQTSDKG